MRVIALSILLLVAIGYHSDGRPSRVASLTQVVNAETSRPVRETDSKIDFATQVKPILEAKCQGCHFSGGKMYHELPFDRSETIKKLGSKLFTRIKDENDRKVIREFLAQE